MKALFLNFENLEEIGGITKKILFEKEALEDKGFKTYLSHIKKDNFAISTLYIDDYPIIAYGNGLVGKINRHIKTAALYDWIKDSNIDLLYVRYSQFANNFYIKLFRKIKSLGVPIFLEIPTFPYDKEIICSSVISSIMRMIEKSSRYRLAKYVDRIVTFSDDSFIWKVPTIKILNGVNVCSIPIKRKRENDNTIILVGVASVLFWHGYDRIIEGLRLYYANNPINKVIFNVVGGNDRNINYLNLKRMVKDYKLDDYVIFHGEKTDVELDKIFDMSDIGVGSLGRHRSGIYCFQSLKNVEYAIRGIPFVYSESCPLFNDEDYILRFNPDESTVNIYDIIKFYNDVHLTPEEIRTNCILKNVDWKDQFDLIIEEFKKIHI